MQEAISFALDGKIKATVNPTKLEDINNVFDEMKKGEIEGCVVLEIAKP